MNYASVVFISFATLSLIWYLINGRKHFTGPPVVIQDAEEATTLEGQKPLPLGDGGDGELGLDGEAVEEKQGWKVR